MASVRTILDAWLMAMALSWTGLLPTAAALSEAAAPASPPQERATRSSPFGSLPAQRAPVVTESDTPVETSSSGSTEWVPRALERVCLKNLNAKAAAEVFQNLCSSSGKVMAQEGSNTVLIVDTEENLPRILREIEKADQAASAMAMETVTLRCLDAKSLATVVVKMLTPYGSAAASETGNALILCDTPDNLPRVIAEIHKADQAPEQVVVEVVLLDVRLGNDTEIGVNWDFLATAPKTVGYRQNFTGLTDRLSMMPNTDDAISQGLAFNTLGTAGELSVVVGNIRNVVHLIQQRRNAQVIASPRAMVASGRKATIKAVEQIPYMVVTQSATGVLQQTQFKDVGVTLDVTATITDAQHIILDAVATQSVQTGTSVGGVPVVDSREGTTHLMLADGQTAVMGGLRRQQRIKQTSQIPLLGDLPVVGRLFRSSQDGIVNAELVVLMSPHIYRGEPISDEVLAQLNRVKNNTHLDESSPGKEAHADRQPGPPSLE